MKVIVDGVIKYDRSNFTHCRPIDLLEYSQLEDLRQKLFKLKLIGESPESQVGYGNLSQRYDYSSWLKTNNPQYLITGTQTGKFPELNDYFGIFCMHGHEDGVVLYGRNLGEAGNIILRSYQQYFK